MTAPNSHEVRVRVGPVVVAFETTEKRLVRWTQEAHPRHITQLPADIRISMSYQPETTFPWVPRNAVRSGHVDELCFWSGRGQFDALSGAGTATLAPMDNEDYERLRMKGLTRIFVARYLLSRGGLSMHASAAIKRGMGHMFIGPSNAGKTTVVTRWPNDIILGDDQILVTRSKNGFRIHDTPYPGNEGTRSTAGSAPLSQICLLEKSELTAVEPLSQAEAFRALSKQVFHIGTAQSDASLILELLDDLSKQVPVVRLKFNLVRNPWDLISPKSQFEVVTHV